MNDIVWSALIAAALVFSALVLALAELLEGDHGSAGVIVGLCAVTTALLSLRAR